VSGEVIRRHTYGIGLANPETFLGIATLRDTEPSGRADLIRVVRDGVEHPESLDDYGAILTDLPETSERVQHLKGTVPRIIHSAEHLEHILFDVSGNGSAERAAVTYS
jgi:hypothetical protein